MINFIVPFVLCGSLKPNVKYLWAVHVTERTGLAEEDWTGSNSPLVNTLYGGYLSLLFLFSASICSWTMEVRRNSKGRCIIPPYGENFLENEGNTKTGTSSEAERGTCSFLIIFF